MNHKYYRIKLILEFQRCIHDVRVHLQQEMIRHGADTMVVQRRYRMLQQLSQFESQSLIKIANFESDFAEDYRIDNFMPAFEIFKNRAA